MKIYNSLTRKLEEFEPLNAPHVGMYTCGPTVYSYATIGNFRTYTNSDTLVRTLTYLGYEVTFVMNLTDVGHLTGDNEGDADTGEDRLEKSAKKEGKTAQEIAEFYSKAFLQEYALMNLTPPKLFAKATDHIPEQIDLIKRLEDHGLTYETSDGVYFDTVKYEQNTHNVYGELSSLDKILEGARVEPNPEKRNPRDFALWKFSYAGGREFDSNKDSLDTKRQMEWKSPWGLGFPGWHIECSAMSMKYLGESFDIHTGGEDLRATHHPNEIAQSEGATGKLFAKYWLHSAFLKVDGKRMGKSLGNAYSVSDVIAKGFDPLSLRYFYLTGHYRSPMNFTWEGLEASANALTKLRSTISGLVSTEGKVREELSEEKMQKISQYRDEFRLALSDDLNTPQALAVLWEVVKSNIPSPDKRDLLLSFDEVLGLNLSSLKPEVKEQVRFDSNIEQPVFTTTELGNEARKQLEDRELAKQNKDYQTADNIRTILEERDGLIITDTAAGTVVRKK